MKSILWKDSFTTEKFKELVDEAKERRSRDNEFYLLYGLRYDNKLLISEEYFKELKRASRTMGIISRIKSNSKLDYNKIFNDSFGCNNIYRSLI